MSVSFDEGAAGKHRAADAIYGFIARKLPWLNYSLRFLPGGVAHLIVFGNSCQVRCAQHALVGLDTEALGVTLRVSCCGPAASR